MTIKNVFNLREGHLSWVELLNAETAWADTEAGTFNTGTGTGNDAPKKGLKVAYVEGRDLRAIHNRGVVALIKRVRERPWVVNLDLLQSQGGFIIPDTLKKPIGIELAQIDEFGGTNQWLRLTLAQRSDFEISEAAEVNMLRLGFTAASGGFFSAGQLVTE